MSGATASAALLPAVAALADLALQPVGIPGTPASATVPDLLRLVAVPAFAWAAYRDVRTRRVPNRLWAPLALLGVTLLVVEAVARLPVDAADRLFTIRVAVSLGLVIPLSYGFWRIGGFGGADAKAFMTLAVLLPSEPTFYLPAQSLPVVDATLGVFALTVLTNTVLLGLAYPLSIATRNLLAGEVSTTMFLALRVPVDRLPSTHGRIVESREGFDRGGLDLDALRMYLRWRGIDLATLRAEPGRYRDPGTVGSTYDPTDGAVATDGGRPERDAAGASGAVTGDAPDADAAGVASGGDAAVDDPWAAAAFLESLGHDAYGTDPGTLREGLALVAERDAVWVSPGIPFIVPTFVGLVVALTYGDLLVAGMRAAGLV